MKKSQQSPASYIPGSTEIRDYTFNVAGYATVERRHEFFAPRAPGSNDDSDEGFKRGSIWMDGGAAYVCADSTPDNASWIFLGLGGQSIPPAIAAELRLREAARRASDWEIYTSFTGLASSQGTYLNGTPASNPSGQGYPFYRLSSPDNTPRTNSGIVIVRSNFTGSSPCLLQDQRGRINFDRPIRLSIKVAAPNPGFGTFQFGFGYGIPTLPNSAPFNQSINDLQDKGFGFRLTRDTPGPTWRTALFYRLGASGFSQEYSSQVFIPDIQLGHEFVVDWNPATKNLSLYENSGLAKIPWVSLQINLSGNSVSAQNINWVAGIAPSGSTQLMEYDIESPTISLT
jgi:hypothetical protein